MKIKDYYKILELEPSATLTEIKKAYRKLAQHLHPDKNPDDKYAVVHFAEIKEAYEVLTNPTKKNYYLQQRWYQQSQGKTKFKNKPVTPPEVLKQFLELDKHISTLDNFRMDKNGLYQHVKEILSDENIEQLRKFNEPDINLEIVKIVLGFAKLLPPPQVEDLAARLISLSGQEGTLAPKINLFVQEHKRRSRLEKYKAGIIILITITISLLIYFVSR
ncbi:MAG: DnaJ domain-containing protein [Bacteroidota bacterium]